MSALDSILRGVAASALGTLAMDALLYRRYRHDGGDAAFPGWESSEGLVSWENAPAPALVAKRLLEGVLKHDVPPRYARLLNNATHWGFGLAAGAGYGLLLGSRHDAEGVVRTPVRRRGLGRRIRRAPTARRLQADLEVRPRDAREGPERAPRLRNRHRGRLPSAGPGGRP